MFAAGALTIAFLAALLARPPEALRSVQAVGFDTLQGFAPRTGEPVAAAVVIGERSLAAFGPWPWPRGQLAQLVEAVADAAPRSIALAVLLDIPAGPPEGGAATAAGDAALARAIERAPTALATAVSPWRRADGSDEPPAVPGLAVEGDAVRPRMALSFDGLRRGQPRFVRAAAAEGAVSLPADRDMILRAMGLGFMVDDAIHPGLPLAALTAAGTEVSVVSRNGVVRGLRLRASSGHDRMIRTDPEARALLDFGRRQAIPTIEAADLLRGGPWTEQAAAALTGRVVVVGVDAPGVSTLWRAADRGLIGGPQALALTVDALANGLTMWRPPTAAAVEVGLMTALGLGIALIWAAARPGWAVALTIAATAAWPAAAAAARMGAGLVIDPFLPPAALLAASAAAAATHALHANRARAALIAALQARTARAERAERSRSAFLAEMTHDLRTPINAIHGAAWAISARARGGDLAGVLQGVHEIEALSGHLRALVGRAVRAAELDSPDPPLELTDIDLRDLLLDARRLAIAASQAAEDMIDLRVAATGVTARADRVYMLEAAMALMTRALTVAGADGPIVARDGLTPDGRAFIEIADEGPPPDQAIRAWAAAPYVRVEALAAARDGAGLALFVAKGVAARHGGTLELAPRGGRGVAIRITLDEARS